MSLFFLGCSFPPMVVSAVMVRRAVDAAERRRASSHKPFKPGHEW